MSREQWGHGYWSGVRDAEMGKVKNHISIQSLSEFLVCHMVLSNRNKTHDRSLFPVSELCTMACFIGLPDKNAKDVYNYVFHKEPFGCYISGAPGEHWTLDYFVLPSLSEKECIETINRIFP